MPESAELELPWQALVLAGVGGQGLQTALEILALAADEIGLTVQTFAPLSLARLGGSACCHLRFGPASTPRIAPGQADLLIALEMSEALRILPLARVGALAFISTWRRPPLAASLRGQPYPDQQTLTAALQQRGMKGIFVEPRCSGWSPSPAGERAAEDEEVPAGLLSLFMLAVCCSAIDLLPRAALEHALTRHLEEEPAIAAVAGRLFACAWQRGTLLRPLPGT
ncbi:2-oxoacid:acceptor oxidoreductase family protein [Thermogemmatispora carboxidivorans]|uniref:2-oxoacid:acceptor oxidoreductase family protein n=1 Tax=Thermogemmatispora carboxidivorans TaxID=1382306 RepID=UPI00069ABAFA|nr:2-oxoacid:acceptor oxidoreductase family protein [Thermogemmatispora carboxidivorans]